MVMQKTDDRKQMTDELFLEIQKLVEYFDFYRIRHSIPLFYRGTLEPNLRF